MTRSHLASTCPPETIENAALLVTELVSNVVVHAHTDMLLVVDVVPGRVDLRVQDSSEATPERQDIAPDAINGRGIAIVEELATSWGVERRQGKKVVWAILDYPVEADAIRGG